MRAALLLPRIPGEPVPSAVAVERVLWLAAVDRCLRVSASDPAEVRAAYQALRGDIDRSAPSLYAQTTVHSAAESRWIVAMRNDLGERDATLRAIVVLWAAVAAWTDAPDGRWSLLAATGAALADALDVGYGHDPAATGRIATKLRAVMAARWATIEGRR